MPAADDLTWEVGGRTGRWTDSGQKPPCSMKEVELIRPPVAQGEDFTLTLSNRTGPDPTGWEVGAYASDEAGESIPLVATIASVVGGDDNVIQVFFPAEDTAAFPVGVVFGEVWREDDDNEYVLRRFEVEVYAPVRASSEDDEIILDGGP